MSEMGDSGTSVEIGGPEVEAEIAKTQELKAGSEVTNSAGSGEAGASGGARAGGDGRASGDGKAGAGQEASAESTAEASGGSAGGQTVAEPGDGEPEVPPASPVYIGGPELEKEIAKIKKLEASGTIPGQNGPAAPGDSGQELRAGAEADAGSADGLRAAAERGGAGAQVRLEAAGAATWGSAPDWNSYPGHSEVVVVDAEEMRRQTELATSRPAPLRGEPGTEPATSPTAPPREELGLEELVQKAGELASQVGEYKKDLKELQKTVEVPDKTMEHSHADAPPADPAVSSMIALGAMAHVVYKAGADNKDAIADKAIEIVGTFNPTWTEAITNLAERHAQEQADLDDHEADPDAKKAEEKEHRDALLARQAEELRQLMERLAIEQPRQHPGSTDEMRMS